MVVQVQRWFFAASPARIPREVSPAVGGIALTAFALGTLAGFCVGQIGHGIPSMPSLPVAPALYTYLLAWSLFHLLEFVVTAYWNETHLQSDSFLLQNGVEYMAAHAFGVLEYIVEWYMVPSWKQHTSLYIIGLALLLVGQALRSLAMIHASTNFSHALALTKREDHVLVTTGVYAYARHPSYAGFFWWAIGTQVLLANPLGLLLFAYALTRFFTRRIRVEEQTLRAFFGSAYTAYAARVPSGVPLVGYCIT
ncbi:farnesyl cysteine-carboxyl methyltransferase [Malassezia pachydermatis]